MTKKDKPMSDEDYINALPEWIKNMPRTKENLEFLREETRVRISIIDLLENMSRQIQEIPEKSEDKVFNRALKKLKTSLRK